MKKVFLILGLVLLIGIPFGVDAQLGLDQAKTAGQTAGLASAEGDTSLTLLVVKFIRAFLALAGVVLIILFVWAGFTWMTAGGDSNKVTEARTRMINATIGLAVIFGAFAIAQFVIGALVKAVT